MNLPRLATTVLRTPSAVPPDLATVPSLLALVGGALGTLGAVVGSYRGGVQIPFAALKLPALVLLPVVVCLPLAAAVVERGTPWRLVSHAALVGAARTALLAAGATPIVGLLYSSSLDYHAAIEVLAGTLAVAGAVGLGTTWRLLPGRVSWTGAAALVVALGLVSAQTGWLLRPFVVRPAGEVALLRPIESDVFSALSATESAAKGRYQEWEPEGSGFLGR